MMIRAQELTLNLKIKEASMRNSEQQSLNSAAYENHLEGFKKIILISGTGTHS